MPMPYVILFIFHHFFFHVISFRFSISFLLQRCRDFSSSSFLQVEGGGGSVGTFFFSHSAETLPITIRHAIFNIRRHAAAPIRHVTLFRLSLPARCWLLMPPYATLAFFILIFSSSSSFLRRVWVSPPLTFIDIDIEYFDDVLFFADARRYFDAIICWCRCRLFEFVFSSSLSIYHFSFSFFFIFFLFHYFCAQRMCAAPRRAAQDRRLWCAAPRGARNARLCVFATHRAARAAVPCAHARFASLFWLLLITSWQPDDHWFSGFFVASLPPSPVSRRARVRAARYCQRSVCAVPSAAQKARRQRFACAQARRCAVQARATPAFLSSIIFIFLHWLIIFFIFFWGISWLLFLIIFMIAISRVARGCRRWSHSSSVILEVSMRGRGFRRFFQAISSLPLSWRLLLHFSGILFRALFRHFTSSSRTERCSRDYLLS